MPTRAESEDTLPDDSKELLEAIHNIQSLDSLMITFGHLPSRILITIRDMAQYALNVKDLL